MVGPTLPDGRTLAPVLALHLEVLDGPDQGATHRATSGTVTVGTSLDNDLVLSDRTVSRYHLEIRREGDRIVVDDLDSTNGTIVSNVRLHRATVPPETVMTLGKTSLRISASGTVTLPMHDDDRLGDLRGRSPKMRTLMARLSKAARSDVSVLLLGETGVGKEVFANALHEESARRSGPFETVDCGALSPNLVASELFGHERGAFTGADQRYEGALERAHGGTLFLDEVGELPPTLQVTLLGALERRRFRRIGGKEPISVDVRIVCATNRDLRGEVNAGTFRGDLYYRVAVVLMKIPPLRERTEDIELLVEHFLRKAGFNGTVDEVIPAEVLDDLSGHRWPGNVRELRNFVEATLAMGEPLDLRGDPATSPEDAVSNEALFRLKFKDARVEAINRFERAYLEALLRRYDQNVSRAARESDIHRSYLNEMLKKHRLR